MSVKSATVAGTTYSRRRRAAGSGYGPRSDACVLCACAGAELPEGIQASVHVRKNSSSPGAIDIYYFDQHHTRYRSKLQVRLGGSCWNECILHVLEACRLQLLALQHVDTTAADFHATSAAWEGHWYKDTSLACKSSKTSLCCWRFGWSASKDSVACRWRERLVWLPAKTGTRERVSQEAQEAPQSWEEHILVSQPPM